MSHGRRSGWSWLGLGISLLGTAFLGWMVVDGIGSGGPTRVGELAELVVLSIVLGVFLTLGWTHLVDILRPPPAER